MSRNHTTDPEASGERSKNPAPEFHNCVSFNSPEELVEVTSTSSLVTRYSGAFVAYGFRYKPTNEEILVLVLGDPASSQSPLVRVHSRCLTGDVFGSIQCECGQQLEMSIEKIQAEGMGIIIYLEQEGRGCGLTAKLRGHELMEKEGLDTVDAYIKLGLPVDCRSYEPAAHILRFFGIKCVRVLTNNPEKLDGLSDAGIEVIREPLEIQPSPWSRDYLRTKKLRMGHLLVKV